MCFSSTPGRTSTTTRSLRRWRFPAGRSARGCTERARSCGNFSPTSGYFQVTAMTSWRRSGMDELQYVRGFRAAVAAGDRDQARTALLNAIAADTPVPRRNRIRLGLLLALVAITGVAVGSAFGVDARIIWTSTKERVDGQELDILAGPIDAVVASVWLRSPDGDERRAAQAEGLYLVALPDERQGYELIARDAAGRDLRTVALKPFTLDLFDSYRPKVTGPPRTVIETTDSRGRPLRLLLQPAERGQTCLIIETVGRGTGCLPADKLRTPSGIAVYPTLEGSIVYLSGSVGPEVSQLTLHYEDGQEVEVPIVERFVLYDIPRAHFNDGARPTLLIGRNSEGVEVARQKVDQDVFGPKSSIWLPGDVSP